MRLLIIGFIVLLLCGGGAGAYFYFFQDAEASVDKHAAQEAKAHDAHSKNVHVEFVELDPLILPIVDNSGVNQTVSLVISFEVLNSEAALQVEKMSPKLKDAFIQDMYGILNRHAALKGGVIQVGMIKKRLNSISTAVLGQNVVNDVLLQVVQQRPI